MSVPEGVADDGRGVLIELGEHLIEAVAHGRQGEITDVSAQELLGGGLAEHGGGAIARKADFEIARQKPVHHGGILEHGAQDSRALSQDPFWEAGSRV